jgi:phosphate acyltransferase
VTEYSNHNSTGVITIALDAMGGDNAPSMVVEGAALAIEQYPDIRFIFCGHQGKLQALLKKHKKLYEISEIYHTEDVVGNDDKPSSVLRQNRNSSMSLAIKAVREKKADCAISAGNTGALMAFSKVMLRTLSGIDRPAICGVLPTYRGFCAMLDLGANVYCDANNLFEFAIMGDAFARVILDLKDPKIGILNIGTEETKGNEAVRDAGTLLKESPLNYYGNIEGDDIGKGIVDVVVTDGFSGNIALKTAEGTAKIYTAFLKEALNGNWMARLGALLAKPMLNSLKKRMDPRLHNGAMLIGLNGIVVKSHGGTDSLGFSSAIKVAYRLANAKINHKIIKEMEQSGYMPVPDNEEDIPLN